MTTRTLRVGTPVTVTRTWGGREFPPVGATGVVVGRHHRFRRVRMDGERPLAGDGKGWMFNLECLEVKRGR